MKQKMIIILICIILISSWTGVITNEGKANSHQDTEIEIKNRSRESVIVDSNGKGDYTKIQDAINNSKDGDTIYVWAGTYHENIVIDRILSLIGNNTANTIINGKSKSDVVTINSNYVNISGFNITGGYDKIFAGIKINFSDYCNVFGNNCTNNYFGIQLFRSNFSSIFNNNCSNNRNTGIFLGDWGSSSSGSNNINISNNLCYNNKNCGIRIEHSDLNYIKNNICKNLYYDIVIGYSNSNNIINNSCKILKEIEDPLGGFSLIISSSNSNKIHNNTFTGIKMYYSISNTIENNILNNKGLIIDDYYLGIINYWASHQVKNNTLNSKPIYFVQNKSNFNIQKNVGQVFLINCNNITIENQFFNNPGENINLINSSNILIRNNTQIESSWNLPGIYLYLSDSNIITNNNCSIHLFYSDFNTIKNNSIEDKVNAIWLGAIEQGGVDHSKFYFLSSNNNKIINNTLENNYRGILIMASDKNMVVNNTCSYNYKGFDLDCGRSNLIHNNTFFLNDIGVYIDSYWEEGITRTNGYSRIYLESEFNKIYYNNILFNSNQLKFEEPSKVPDYGIDQYSITEFNNSNIGNYWSDYNGSDDGSNGRIANDGIGDTKIPWHDVDWYPLINLTNISVNTSYIYKNTSKENNNNTIENGNTSEETNNKTVEKTNLTEESNNITIENTNLTEESNNITVENTNLTEKSNNTHEEISIKEKDTDNNGFDNTYENKSGSELNITNSTPVNRNDDDLSNEDEVYLDDPISQKKKDYTIFIILGMLIIIILIISAFLMKRNKKKE